MRAYTGRPFECARPQADRRGDPGAGAPGPRSPWSAPQRRLAAAAASTSWPGSSPPDRRAGAGARRTGRRGGHRGGDPRGRAAGARPVGRQV